MKPIASILILAADRLYAEALEDAGRRAFPAAEIVRTHRLVEAADAIETRSFDLLLSGVDEPDGDVCNLLSDCVRDPRRVAHVFIITTRHEVHLLLTLERLAVDGVFDAATEQPENLVPVLHGIAAGQKYWSGAPFSALIRQKRLHNISSDDLTLNERLVLAAIGDGSSDAIAADQLQLSESTVQGVRSNLYRKLGANSKGDIVRIAVQKGYVRFTPDGVIRPGFGQLLAARRTRNGVAAKPAPKELVRFCSDDARGGSPYASGVGKAIGKSPV